MLSIGTDSRIRLWDVASVRNTMVNFGRIVLTGRTTVRMAMTPIDSGVQVVFVPSSTDVVAFNIDDGQRISVLRGHYKQVNVAAYWSPLRTLFTGSNDRAIVVWTPESSEPPLGGRRPKGDVQVEEGRAGLGSFSRRVGGGTADSWSDDDD